VTKLLRMADQRAMSLLIEQKEKLETLTRALIEQEELDEREIGSIIGPSVHEQPKP
jgi:cell division protease FtsH